MFRRDRGGTERGEEIGHWRRKVEDKDSVTFFFRVVGVVMVVVVGGRVRGSLLTLSQSCRTCRCGADRRFVWTGGSSKEQGEVKEC